MPCKLNVRAPEISFHGHVFGGPENKLARSFVAIPRPASYDNSDVPLGDRLFLVVTAVIGRPHGPKPTEQQIEKIAATMYADEQLLKNSTVVDKDGFGWNGVVEPLRQYKRAFRVWMSSALGLWFSSQTFDFCERWNLYFKDHTVNLTYYACHYSPYYGFHLHQTSSRALNSSCLNSDGPTPFRFIRPD